MSFEWTHTTEDHLDALEYQFLHISKGKFALANRRKGRINLFIIVSIPVVVIYLINFNQQTTLSLLWGLVALFFVFWVLVFKKPSEAALVATANGYAKRYLSKLSVIPVGTHRLSTDGSVLEWHWIDGDERCSFPISQIEHVVQTPTRIFFVRKGDASDSLPLSAFENAHSHEAFLNMINASIGRNRNA